MILFLLSRRLWVIKQGKYRPEKKLVKGKEDIEFQTGKNKRRQPYYHSPRKHGTSQV